MGINPDYHLSTALLDHLSTKEKAKLVKLILNHELLIPFRCDYMFDFFLYFLEDLKSSSVENDEYVLIYQAIDFEVAIENYFSHIDCWRLKIDFYTVLTITKDFYDYIFNSEIHIKFLPPQSIVAYTERFRKASE